MTQEQKTVAILGGGSGGVVAANILRKLLPREHRVILIDKESEHLFAPSLLWVMIGDRSPTKISRPLNRLERRGIDVVQGEIRAIDPEKRTVQVNNKAITADAMIVALGADYAPQNVKGLAESGYNAYTLRGATVIRDELNTFKSGRIVILTAAPAYKCPAAPYEAAMLVEYHCRRLGIRDKTEIAVYAAEPGPMGTAGPEVSKRVRQMVESKGVAYHPNHQITEVDEKAKLLKFADGTTAPFDLLIYVPPHVAPQVVKDAGMLSESGWIAVDRNTLETKFKDVYAVGDVTSISLKMGKPLPKAGVFAHAQAEVVAHNIAAKLTGRGTPTTFNGNGKCFIEVGDNRAGIGDGNFYAEPAPQVNVKRPSVLWHWSKIWFEKHWLRHWF
jgi:sulfide:quinone oxidoreductase